MTTLGRKKTETIFWQIFRERYPKQVLYFVKVNTNGKLETRTKGIVDKCSDLTCTKKYALTEGAKGGGELMWANRSAPPVILCLLRAFGDKAVLSLQLQRNVNARGGGLLPYKGLMGTCDQLGYVFRDFCLKQGIGFINFCLKQGIFS